MSKKNLQTLFQEKFENYELPPPENAWVNIEHKLKEKDKRKRILPFWWGLTGVAAGLVIAFFCYPFLFNYQNKQEATPVVKVDGQGANETTTPELQNTSKQNSSPQGAENNSQYTVAGSSEVLDNGTSDANDANATEKQSSKISTKNHFKNNTSIALHYSKNNKVASSQSESKTVASEQDVNTFSNDASTPQKSSNLSAGNPLKKYSKEFSNPNMRIFSEVNVVQHSKEVDASIKKDSAAVEKVVPNALEELLKEKEKKVVAEQKTNQWEVEPNVAPIFFSSFTNGSPLDSRFQNNAKSYTTNYSYGVGINYEVSKKISIRSGLNTFAVDYNTNGITFSQSNTATAKMEHLNPNNQGATIQIDNSTPSATPLNKMSAEKQQGSINQKMGYVEMPIELSYKLLNSKFGVNVIGGFSTLFLNQNAIYLNSSESSTKIGVADNLNAIHFSTNVGLGLKYGVSKKVNLKMEPVFKYQINTYNSDSGGFKPYLFGIYSGISYTF